MNLTVHTQSKLKIVENFKVHFNHFGIKTMIFTVGGLTKKVIASL